MTGQFIEQLALVAGSARGVALLRNAVLDFAIRGLLVTQDGVDEPADVLLARITALKVTKQSRLKTTQEADATAPYALPRGWAWTTLADVALINPRNQADDESEASFVPMALIGTGFGDAHAQEVRRWGDIKTGFTHFAEGDIGVAKITPCFENSKACVFSGLINGIGAGTTELHVVRPVDGTLAPRYVLAYLKSPWFLHHGESMMTGTAGQKRLPKDFVERHPFPLPPLSEQYRIVAKVDELMALCDRLEARQDDAEAARVRLVRTLLAGLAQARDAEELQASWQLLSGQIDELLTTSSAVDALRETTLECAFAGHFSSSMDREWTMVKLGSVATLINGDRGSNYPNRTEYVEAGVPFINTGHINPDGSLDLGQMHYITEAKFDSLRSGKIEPDDLVYCLRGATLGKTAFVRPFKQGAIASSLVILRFNPTVDPEFAYFFLISPQGRRWIKKFDNGSAQPNLAAASVREYLMPLPPLVEQRRIVAKVTQLLALCDRLKARITAARAKHAQLSKALVEAAVA